MESYIHARSIVKGNRQAKIYDISEYLCGVFLRDGIVKRELQTHSSEIENGWHVALGLTFQAPSIFENEDVYETVHVYDVAAPSDNEELAGDGVRRVRTVITRIGYDPQQHRFYHIVLRKFYSDEEGDYVYEIELVGDLDTIKKRLSLDDDEMEALIQYNIDHERGGQDWAMLVSARTR